jgi:SAM-dependent methyltransferase
MNPTMNPSIEEYLRPFEPIAQLSRQRLLDEMDAVWDALGLDNTRALAEQRDAVGHFYGHPVWVLNGLFSAVDPESVAHREAIVEWARECMPSRVADYGGGSGVLAGMLAQRLPLARVEIIEPFPSPYFVERVEAVEGVRYVSALQGSYDLVVAQDVLEHVDAPVELALELAAAVKQGGFALFANSFWPEIKCHLPATFYLRYQFVRVMRAAGLRAMGHVPGVRHALIFRREGPLDSAAALRVAKRAKWIGFPLNLARHGASQLKSAIKGLGR